MRTRFATWMSRAISDGRWRSAPIHWLSLSRTTVPASRKTRLLWSRAAFSAAATSLRSEAGSDYRSSISRCARAARSWFCKTGAAGVACVRKLFGRSLRIVKYAIRRRIRIVPASTGSGRISRGEMLVARDGDLIVGHLQLLETGDAGMFELKSMAVDEARQREGIGYC